MKSLRIVLRSVSQVSLSLAAAEDYDAIIRETLSWLMVDHQRCAAVVSISDNPNDTTITISNSIAKLAIDGGGGGPLVRPPIARHLVDTNSSQMCNADLARESHCRLIDLLVFC